MDNPPRLWDYCAEGLPAPEIHDTRDRGVQSRVGPASTLPVKWRLPITAGLALALGATVLAVGAYIFRQAPPEVVHASADESTDAPAVVQSETVFVHVVGAVQKPGLIEVPAQSRVLDAIQQAGGAAPDAALEGVNLARLVFDGEQIMVPRIGEDGVPLASDSSGLISLSTADAETLDTLPRIGPATAQRIIAWREENGPFRSVEDLLAISGIGEATLEGLRTLVTP